LIFIILLVTVHVSEKHGALWFLLGRKRMA